MKACLTLFVTIGVQAVAFAQSTNPLTAGARLHYGIIKDSVTRAAVKMPEELYAFRPTPDVRSFGEILDHILAKAAFIIQHIMGNADALRHALGVINVRARATGALARRRLVFRIKLQGDAHHVETLALEQRGGDGGVDATAHRGNDSTSRL